MNVLIIEDDPMVAMIHQEFCKKSNCIEQTIVANTLHQARLLLEKEVFDFVLLDNYMPDGKGVQFVEEHKLFPVIMITAAQDNATVKRALQSGVVDYLVKPFAFERFEKAISKIVQLKTVMNGRISQNILDNYFAVSSDKENVEMIQDELPKGLSKITLRKIVLKLIEQLEPFSIQQIAKAVEISRISIKKYLDYLESMGCVMSDAEYTTKGRPAFIYEVIDKQKMNQLIN